MQCSFLVLLIVQHILISCVNKDVLRPHDSLVLDFPRVYFQLQVVGGAVDPLYNEEHDVLDSRVSGGKIFSFLVSLTYLFHTFNSENVPPDVRHDPGGVDDGDDGGDLRLVGVLDPAAALLHHVVSQLLQQMVVGSRDLRRGWNHVNQH